MSIYEQLAAIDFGNHVETKGKFSYISWAWAIDQLQRVAPSAKWEVKRFPILAQPEIKVPYMETPLGYFVEVEVTIGEVSRSQIHPVLDHQNKPVAKPTPFHINTSIQRALVKSIGLHGLGLYVYAGEDLPPDLLYDKKKFEAFKKIIGNGEAMRLHHMQATQQDLYMSLHKAYIDGAPNGEKGKFRDSIDSLVKQGFNQLDQYCETIKEATIATDDSVIIVVKSELDDREAAIVRDYLTPEQLAYFDSVEGEA